MFLGMPGLNGDSYSASQVRALSRRHPPQVPNPVSQPEDADRRAPALTIPPHPQVESLRHSMGPGSYGDNLGGGQMYSPREMRVSGP